MAKYRHVYCKFWNDPDVLEYTPEDRYFYLYLITNEHSTQCGIYEISKKVMSFETGYNQDTIENLIKRFENRDKIKYDRSTKEIAILNWPKYNLQNTGKPILDCVKKELEEVKSLELVKLMKENIGKKKIKALYDSKLDGPTTEGGTQGGQKEKEKEKEKQKENKKEEVQEEKNRSEIPDAFRNAFNKNITPFQMQNLQSYLEDGLSEKMIIYSLKLAAENNADSLNYATAILDNWLKNDIKNKEQAEKQKLNYKNKGGSDDRFSKEDREKEKGNESDEIFKRG